MNTKTNIAMRLSLSAVKYFASMSEETSCFQAVVHIDGQPAFRAENRGTGGPTDFSPIKSDYEGMRAAVASVEAYAGSLPKYVAFETELEHTAESLIDDLLHEHLLAKDYARMVKSKIVILDGAKVLTLKTVKAPDAFNDQERERMLRVIAGKHPKGEVLNFLPNNGGCERFIAHSREHS